MTSVAHVVERASNLECPMSDNDDYYTFSSDSSSSRSLLLLKHHRLPLQGKGIYSGTETNQKDKAGHVQG
jgi:hypothetical protein